MPVPPSCVLACGRIAANAPNILRGNCLCLVKPQRAICSRLISARHKAPCCTFSAALQCIISQAAAGRSLVSAYQPALEMSQQLARSERLSHLLPMPLCRACHPMPAAIWQPGGAAPPQCCRTVRRQARRRACRGPADRSASARAPAPSAAASCSPWAVRLPRAISGQYISQQTAVVIGVGHEAWLTDATDARTPCSW